MLHTVGVWLPAGFVLVARQTAACDHKLTDVLATPIYTLHTAHCTLHTTHCTPHTTDDVIVNILCHQVCRCCTYVKHLHLVPLRFYTLRRHWWGATKGRRSAPPVSSQCNSLLLLSLSLSLSLSLYFYVADVRFLHGVVHQVLRSRSRPGSNA